VTYKVTGIGLNGVNLSYSEKSIDNAKYLAAKMKDNGVKRVIVMDETGKAINIVDSYSLSKNHWRASTRQG
jgi:tryptophanase